MTAPRPAAFDPSQVARYRRIDEVGLTRAFAEGRSRPRTVNEHTGLALVAVDGPGRLAFSWRPQEHLSNMGGIVHGGYVAMVLDDAAGLAAAARADRLQPCLTTELSVQYLRPTPLGTELRVEGEVLHAGRTRIVADGRILAPDGTLLATGRGSFTPNRAYAPAVMDPDF